jgi:DNA-binding Xre family transcriptional regulator
MQLQRASGYTFRSGRIRRVSDWYGNDRCDSTHIPPLNPHGTISLYSQLQLNMKTQRTKTPKQDFLNVYSIGLKLRTLRNEKRLTLARLSLETGFSAALLSKLETDSMVPTFPTLARICSVYGIGLSYFFSEPTYHTLAITRNAHIAGGSRVQRREAATVKVTRMHVPTSTGKLVAKLLEIPPGTTVAVSEVGLKTNVIAYVLGGTLQLSLNASREVLEFGDCVVLDTDGFVVWSAVGNTPCHVLSVSPR